MDRVEDDIRSLAKRDDAFEAQGRQVIYRAKRVLLATGLTHIPPEIPGVRECLGKSLFFCKDCDAYRVQGKRIVIVGRNKEAVRYAMAMLLYSPSVKIATNGKAIQWDREHALWLQEYRIPIREDRIVRVNHEEGYLRELAFEPGGSSKVDAVFTIRGDVYHTGLAEGVGAALDEEGQVIVDKDLRSSVSGLYAAGCVTPANCQLIIAAGQGAAAAQAINRDLFEESLRTHSLPVYGQSMTAPRPKLAAS
ncbi:MAG: hypothetical protein C4293_20730 [Nitrospiraceae bacterium]